MKIPSLRSNVFADDEIAVALDSFGVYDEATGRMGDIVRGAFYLGSDWRVRAQPHYFCSKDVTFREIDRLRAERFGLAPIYADPRNS